MNHSSRPLLVFDLDETLIHCQNKDFRESEHTTPHGFVAIRHGVEEMLDGLAEHYDFMIWSNSGRPYIDDMLKLFWPTQHSLIDIFTSAESIVIGVDGMGVPFLKETRKVANRHRQYRLDRILGVDDKPNVYQRNFGNLIAVSPFLGGYDEQLLQLTNFLIKIAGKDNLRKIEKRYWRTEKAVSLQSEYPLNYNKEC